VKPHETNVDQALGLFSVPPPEQMEADWRDVLRQLRSPSGEVSPEAALVPFAQTHPLWRRWPVLTITAATVAIIFGLIVRSGSLSIWETTEKSKRSDELTKTQPVPPIPVFQKTVRPVFEAASVRTNKSEPGNAHSNLTQRGGHLILSQASLRRLLLQAYDLPNLSDAHDRILGLPSWGDEDEFDIEAVAEGNPTTAQKRLMLQSLLADRFKLALHQETRQRPVYALMMVKAGSLGPQLRRHANNAECQQDVPPSPADAKRQSTPAAAAMAAMKRFSCGRVVGGLLPDNESLVWSGGRRVAMNAIAASIGEMEMFDRTIVNRTGLNGDFDFIVEWQAGVRTYDNLTGNEPSLGLSLVEALREKLGFRLVAQTAAVDVFVIDHVEKPKPN
jgi:uncharacterized protein (TIGR03435 family)